MRIDRPAYKRRASHPLPQAAFKLASFLRHPGFAQAFIHALAASEIDGIVAQCASAKTAERELREASEAHLNLKPRFTDVAKKRQRGPKIEMQKRIIPVEFNSSSAPSNRLPVLTEVQLSGRSV